MRAAVTGEQVKTIYSKTEGIAQESFIRQVSINKRGAYRWIDLGN